MAEQPSNDQQLREAFGALGVTLEHFVRRNPPRWVVVLATVAPWAAAASDGIVAALVTAMAVWAAWFTAVWLRRSR